jgi:hypothetical protein
MKKQAAFFSRVPNFPRTMFLMVMLALMNGPAARAGLTVDIHTYRYPGSFVSYGWLSTNATPPAAPFGDYTISSPNGSFLRYQYDANGFDYVTGGGTGTTDFIAYMNALTNGQWTIQVTNATSTNTYYFDVSATGLNANLFITANITSPANDAQNVSDDPTFTWTGGPVGWQGTVEPSVHDPDYNYYAYNSLSPSTTSWSTPNPPLPLGTNVFHVVYLSNATANIIASTPLDLGANPISGWVSTANLDVNSDDVTFVVGQGNAFDAFLVARYNFEDPNDPGNDTSGNDNDNNCTGSSGPNEDVTSTAAAAGTRSREFFGDSSICFTDGGNAFPNLSNAISGSFTVTAWVKTTGEVGVDEDEAYWGMPVLYADGDGANYAHPLSITGTKAAFTVYDENEDPTTVHSTSTVNDGNYHFIAVTRNLSSGLMSMYVDGTLEATATGTTEPLVPATYFDIAGGNAHYEGLLDDVRVYSIALNANDVAILAGNEPPNPAAHTLKAHYSFENANIFATDYSGNGNNVTSIASSGGGTRYTTNNPALGNFSAYFDNNSGAGSGSLFATNALLPILAGSFTVSLWVQTTQISGLDTDSIFNNAGLVSAMGPGNWVVPMALAGNKLAFATGGSPQNTLRSTVAITNDSEFVHLVVTRNRTTGEKKIYVNGAFDVSATGSTELLDTDTTLRIGSNNGKGLQGAMDEIQFYEGVLSDSEIAFLYNNPGSTVPDDTGGGSGQLAEAVDAPQFNWITGGDANWFSQTTETHDTEEAAQSGAIGDDQSAWIETTINGPGTLSFWWRVDSDDSFGYDYLEFSIEGNNWSEISGDYGWEYSDVHLDSGPQTVRWTYNKDFSDSAGADAAWLDEVSFIPDTPPVITFQPIDQVNYSGYPVNLVADASGIPEPSWQWYKVGTGLIPGATSRFYSPTNSGTAGVAGSYYAIAINDLDSAITRTAVVSFVSAPLAPDWSKAFNSQLTGSFETPRTNYGIATLVDASGNIYSATSFTGTNEFGSETFAAGPGRFGAGLFKYTTNGAAIWGRAITNNGNGNSYPQCLARAPGDGVYMSGVFLGTNGIGTNVLQETAGASLYLARFDAAGNVLWVRTFGGTNSQFQTYHQLVSDPSGNVTLSALGNNFVDFGTTNVVLEGQKGVLVQYDADGNVLWIEKPSGWVTYMTYAAGRIYAVLNGSETNYIGGLTNVSDRKYALAALAASTGQALWLQGVGSLQGEGNPMVSTDDIPSVSVSGSDLFLTGNAWGSNATFGAFTVSWLTPNGQYFARFDTNGTAQLATTFGGTNVWPWAAVADASGHVYVTGDFNGYASFGNITIGGARLGGIQDGFYGQMFLAKFDRDGTSLWVRQSQSEAPTSFLNVRDLNLAQDGVWVCGFVNYEGNLGTHQVNGPVTIIGFPFGFIHYWVGGFLAKVTESIPPTPGLPVTLLLPQQNGSNFQFQFLSQSGKTNTVQSRTNLTLGTWLDRTNILGDGNSKIVILPVGSASTEFFRILTQ